MAFGSRTVAEYDVGFNIDLGKVTGQLGAVGETFTRTTGQMSNDAIRLSVAQDKLTRAIARSGPESTAAKTALLNYRRELEALQHTQTATVAATGRHTSALKQEERELSGASRGALAASGVFRGLGRAVAFSSGTFLGGAGLVFAIKEATKAAADQETAEGQLETALKNRGIAVDGVRGRVDALIASNAKLGFGELDVTKSLTLAVTATGSLEGATRLLSVAQNVARAKGIDLADAARITVQGFEGQSKALRALGVDVTKGAKGFQVLDEVQAKYAGRAVAYASGPAGAYARLNAELERTKVTIGRELLPAELRIADAVSNWLGKTKNQEKIQRDLNAVVKVGSEVGHDLGVVLEFIAHHGEIAKDVLETLIALKIVGTVSHWATAVTLFTRSLRGATIASQEAAAAGGIASAETAIAGTGAAAVTARTQVAGLRTSLAGLGALTLAPIVIPLEIQMADQERSWLTQHAGILGRPGKVLLDLATGPIGDPHILHDLGIGGGSHKTSKKPAGTAAGYAGSSPQSVDQVPFSGTFSGTKLPTPKGTPLDRLSRIQLALASAQAGVARGDKDAQAQLVAALKAEIDYDRDYEKKQENLLRTDVKHRASHATTLQRLYADEQSALDQIASLDQKNETAKTAKIKKQAAAKKKAVSDRDALIARLYREDTASGRIESTAAAALAARSAGMNKLYADRIKEAQSADKTTAAKTATPTLTRADIRGEVVSAIATLHDILGNESNVTLKMIHTRLLQSENHLRIIRQSQALSQADTLSRSSINAHLARQAGFA